MSSYIVTRRIAIDAGHRIASHGSKCRNLHGHRYDIEAECRAVTGLHETGEQAGMAVDFGFLKQAMMAIIDGPCDHGLIVDVNDRALLDMLAPETGTEFRGSESRGSESWGARLAAEVADQGWAERQDGRLATKLYVIDRPPTAEALARHWFDRLAPWVQELSLGKAALSAVTVHETPNCTACYRP